MCVCVFWSLAYCPGISVLKYQTAQTRALYGALKVPLPGITPHKDIHKYPIKKDEKIRVNGMEMPGMFNIIDINGPIS